MVYQYDLGWNVQEFEEAHEGGAQQFLSYSCMVEVQRTGLWPDGVPAWFGL